MADTRFKDLLDYYGIEDKVDYGDFIAFDSPVTGELAYYYPGNGNINGFLLGGADTGIDDVIARINKYKDNNRERIFSRAPAGLSKQEFIRDVYEPAVSKYAENIFNQSQGHIDKEKARRLSEEKYREIHGDIDNIYRGYEKFNKQKTYHPDNEEIKQFMANQYFKDNKMKYRNVPISKLIADNDLNNPDVLNNRHWKNTKFDFSKKDPNNPIRASIKNGKHILADGRHRIKALADEGYTHAYMPVIDDQE